MSRVKIIHSWDQFMANVRIGDTSLIKYITKHIKPMTNINNIMCGCETYISAVLLQSDFNK